MNQTSIQPLRATLRLQFHKDFTLDDAVPLVPYFARLGISHVYASPLLSARAGSMHGYDVVDPTKIAPALGGEEGLRTFAAALRDAGLGARLVQHLLARASASAVPVLLTTHSERTVRFYERLGFELTDTQRVPHAVYCMRRLAA